MVSYNNISGDSNVIGYDLYDDGITVYFIDGFSYTYTNQSAGEEVISQMKYAAQTGEGLNSLINQNAKYNYVQKEYFSSY
jgi:hypothetical protein